MLTFFQHTHFQSGGSCRDQVYSFGAKILIPLTPCFGPGLGGPGKIWLPSTAPGSQSLPIRVSSPPAPDVSPLSLVQVLERSFPSCVWGFISPPMGVLSFITPAPFHPAHRFLPAHLCWARLHRKTRIALIQLPTQEEAFCRLCLNLPQACPHCRVAHFHCGASPGICKFFLVFILDLLP